MAKVVVFNINDGNFEQGFPVILQINEEGKPLDKEEKGRFPSAPDIPDLYRSWQEKYNNLEVIQRKIKVEAQIGNFSTPRECREAAKDLKEHLKRWFQEADFLRLSRFIQEELGKDESARIIFQTDNEILKKLPWHLWDLFQSRPKAWLSLSARRARNSKKRLRKPVRILAILVSSEGINPNLDENLLNKLPGAKVEPLRNPTQQQLYRKLRQEEDPWDILYFAGHSKSQNGGNDGQIQINNIDSPSMSELRNAFRKAIRNGLSLVIFNSCDGLGLANQLAKLEIPQVIVMREIVPDEVAQEFLQEFLRLFSSGKPFYLAMREAQESLEFVENEYPCASWLPIICQNPASVPPRWPQPLIDFKKIKRFFGLLFRWLRRERTIVIIALMLSVISLLLLFQIPKNGTVKSPSSNTQTISSTNLPNIDQYFSRGERTLLNQPPTTDAKTQGTKDFESALNPANALKWKSAIENFITSLEKNKNDPETLIYLNNAIAMKQGNPLVIAVNVIKSDKDRSEEILRGVAHAQSQFNCKGVNIIMNAIKNSQIPICHGGLNNRFLLVEIIDETDNPQTFNKIIDHIVNGEGKKKSVLAVVGPYSSQAALAVKEYHQKLIFISPTSTSNELNSNKLDIWRTATNDQSAAQTFNKYVQDPANRNTIKPIKAFVANVAKEPYSQSLTTEFQEFIPDKRYVDTADLSSDSAEQIVRKIKDKQINLLLLVPSTASNTLKNALEVVESISTEYNNKIIILAGDAMYARSIQTQKVQTTKLVVAVPWHQNNSSEKTTLEQNFEEDAKTIWGNYKINWRTVMSYDATQAIIKALEQNQGNLNIENLRKTLTSTDFSAPGAIINVEFNDRGERSPQTKDDNEKSKLGVLVKIECNSNGSNCYFVKVQSNE